MTLVERNNPILELPVVAQMLKYIEDGAPDMHEPTSEIKQDEQAVGQLSLTVRKLWGARELSDRTLKDLTLKYLALKQELNVKIEDGLLRKDQLEEDPEYIRLHHEIIAAGAIYESLDKLLWASVRQEYPAVIMDDIGVRKNWTVCRRKPKSGPSLTVKDVENVLELLLKG